MSQWLFDLAAYCGMLQRRTAPRGTGTQRNMTQRMRCECCLRLTCLHHTTKTANVLSSVLTAVVYGA